MPCSPELAALKLAHRKNFAGSQNLHAFYEDVDKKN